MQQHFEQFVGKQRRVELKSVRNFVAKAVLVEVQNSFHSKICLGHSKYLTYFLKPYRPSDRLEKT